MLLEVFLNLLGFWAGIIGLYILPLVVIIIIVLIYRQNNHRGFVFIAVGQFLVYGYSLIYSFFSINIIPLLIESGMELNKLDTLHSFINIISLINYVFYGLFFLVGLSFLANDLRLNQYKDQNELSK